MWTLDEGKDLTELCFHGNTGLADGRQGLLIDPGAWSNLAGEIWIQKMARKALDAGLKVGQNKLDKPLNVAGVGNGTNNAQWETQVPIALNNADGNVTMHAYNAPTVGGEGKGLPALLGLQSMSRQNSVLEMAPGQEFLTLPGPGGYTINWSPGTTRHKLEKAPSGHLILPCDEYHKVDKNPGGLGNPMTTYLGVKVKAPKTTCEIGTQTNNADEPRKKRYEKTRKHSQDE